MQVCAEAIHRPHCNQCHQVLFGQGRLLDRGISRSQQAGSIPVRPEEIRQADIQGPLCLQGRVCPAGDWIRSDRWRPSTHQGEAKEIDSEFRVEIIGPVDVTTQFQEQCCTCQGPAIFEG